MKIEFQLFESSSFEVTQILITLFSRERDGSLARALEFPAEACFMQSGSSSALGNLGKNSFY